MPNYSSKGIIYCRVSSHDQVHGTSLDNQKRACLQFAENKGIQILEIFIEKGESATAANRTEFLKALDYCRKNKGRISAFIVWKIDRFARNTTDHFAVRAKLLQYGVIVHSVTEPISQDPQGKLMETLLAGFAEFENEVKKQRCTAGMQARLREGIWLWTPPIGYINSKKSSDRRKLRPDEPDPERFHLIQRALKAYSSGDYTIVKLTALMNKWGLRTRTGKPIFEQLTDRILTDKFYAGIIVDPWTGDEYQGQHKPMISLAEYFKVQLVKSTLSNHATRARQILNPDFPLRGFVSCICGQTYTAGWRKGRNKRYPYYHCHNRECEHYINGIPKSLLENRFTELLNRVALKENFLKFFKFAVVDTCNNKKIADSQEKKNYQDQLNRLESRKEQLIQMRLNNEINGDDFLRLKDKLDIQISQIRLSEQEANTGNFDIEKALSFVIPFLSNPDRIWQNMKTIGEKQHYQKVVFPKGFSYDKSSDAYCTAILSPIFKLNEEFEGDKTHLVAGAGFAPAISRL